jgi:hypothetical protein
MVTPEDASRRRTAGDVVSVIFVDEMDETAYGLIDSLPAKPSANQDRVRITMVKALRQWLEANELPAIIVGVLCAVLLLATLLVVGGYLFVTR